MLLISWSPPCSLGSSLVHPHTLPAVVSSELWQPMKASRGIARCGNTVAGVAIGGGYETGFTEAAAAIAQLYLQAI